ncbi:hypothetical protein [Citrobacter freundii]|uniref:hypothetical protein n=1 Tax=Citrobacter freundii TaxID=546 RepID=UPI003C6F6796
MRDNYLEKRRNGEIEYQSHLTPNECNIVKNKGAIFVIEDAWKTSSIAGCLPNSLNLIIGSRLNIDEAINKHGGNYQYILSDRGISGHKEIGKAGYFLIYEIK